MTGCVSEDDTSSAEKSVKNLPRMFSTNNIARLQSKVSEIPKQVSTDTVFKKLVRQQSMINNSSKEQE